MPVAPAIKMEPTLQLTFYENRNPEHGTVVYIESRPVFAQKNTTGVGPKIRYVPGSPRPMQSTDLAHMAKTLQNHLIAVPPYFGYGNMLAYQPNVNGTKIMWYVEGGDRHLNFGGSMQGLGSGTVNLPRTVFYAYKEKLDIFCLPDGPITSQTPLLMSPFPNTNNFGGVCTGTAHIPNPATVVSVDVLMQNWEQLFFYSHFTHFGGYGEPGEVDRTGRIVGSLGDLWHMLMREKSKFPIHYLKPDPKGRTVGDLQAMACK